MAAVTAPFMIVVQLMWSYRTLKNRAGGYLLRSGKVEVLVPDDIRTPEVVSMARFAKMSLEGHLKALLDTWEGAEGG